MDHQTEPWGIKVSAVEVKDAELALTMVRALSRQAEAEHEKRARSSPPRGVRGCADAGRRRQGHHDPAGGPGPAPHADAARHGLEPELHDRLPNPDRADPATPRGTGADGGAGARRGARTGPATQQRSGLMGLNRPWRAGRVGDGMIAQQCAREVAEHARIDQPAAPGEAARLAPNSPGSGPGRQAAANPMAAGSRPAARGSPEQPAPAGARVVPRPRLRKSARRLVGLLAHRPFHVPGGNVDAGREAAQQQRQLVGLRVLTEAPTVATGAIVDQQRKRRGLLEDIDQHRSLAGAGSVEGLVRPCGSARFSRSGSATT